jgi:hypothetical protein
VQSKSQLDIVADGKQTPGVCQWQSLLQVLGVRWKEEIEAVRMVRGTMSLGDY